MKKAFVVSPEAINILGADSEFRPQSSEIQLQPEPPKQPLWQKALALSQDIDVFIKPIITTAATFALVINAVARYMNASRAGGKGRGK